MPQKYLRIVADLAASGALGAALLLGATPPAAANTEPASGQPNAAPAAGVAERLAAIRAAVSAAARADATTPDRLRLAWGNWHNGWHRGGWGGPWGNFGFGLPWNNWNNWHNGWHNWRNFWHNW